MHHEAEHKFDDLTFDRYHISMTKDTMQCMSDDHPKLDNNWYVESGCQIPKPHIGSINKQPCFRAP